MPRFAPATRSNAVRLAGTLALVLAGLPGCARFGYNDVNADAGKLPGVLGNDGQLDSNGQPTGDPNGSDPNSSLDCNLGTLSDCASCGNDCTTQGWAGVAEYACVSASCAVASCAPGFADCNHDPSDGCETPVDTLTDCGSCGVPCSIANASASCATGTCELVACNTGYGNCDGDLASNGCERPLNSLTNCGGCGVTCSATNATASCDSGICELSSCNAGFDNCDRDNGNGCETALDTLTDCGGCGVPCSVAGGQGASCSGGVCSAAACVAGFADCDADGTSCETDLHTLQSCVSCNTRCGDANGRLPHATASCGSGSCDVGSCDPGFGNCDGSPGNGCELPLDSVTDCGACDVPCSRANAMATCSSGSCQIAGCNSGFSDCDGDDRNGCEAQLGSHDHCSGCNQACDANSVCSGGHCIGQFSTFTPSNIDVQSLDATSARDLSLNCGGVVTLDTGSLNSSGWCGQPAPQLIVQTRTNGPDLLVLPLRSLDIGSGTTFRVSGSRALAIAVFGDANIEGTLDVSAQGTNGGAGNEWNCKTSQNDSTGTNGSGTSGGGGGGGGGGAFRSNGGGGGNGAGSAGGQGGSPRGSDLLSPILPGCNGGWGGGCGAGPGGGGGAVNLAVAGNLAITGSVLAQGAPGQDGCGNKGGASGGGSGGAILLEANVVTFTSGDLLAGGGDGGRGSNGGSSGLGSSAGSGQNGGSSSNGGGGGGGSAGRVRIFAAQSCALGGNSAPSASTSCP